MIQSQGFALQLFLTHGENGSSETWHVPPILDPQFTINLNAILQARRNILAAGCQLVWAQLLSTDPPYWILPLVTSPLDALPQWGPVASDEVGLWWAFQTGQGQVGGRCFRFVEGSDIWFPHWGLNPHKLPDGIPPLPSPISTATKEQLVINAFCTLRQMTQFSRRLPNLPDGTPQYLTWPWTDAFFQDITSRNVGRAYKPVSWEARPRANAPAFSPCGSVVGVARSCLEMPCRFYVGAAPQRIRFYWSKPNALALPIKNIFWPSYEVREITNGTRTGIITPPHRNQWEEGTEIGNAPGIGYTGTQADFLGQSSVLWSPETPTPSWLLPACDLPVADFLLQEDGGFLLQEDDGLIELEGE